MRCIKMEFFVIPNNLLNLTLYGFSFSFHNFNNRLLWIFFKIFTIFLMSLRIYILLKTFKGFLQNFQQLLDSMILVIWLKLNCQIKYLMCKWATEIFTLDFFKKLVLGLPRKFSTLFRMGILHFILKKQKKWRRGQRF